MDFDTLYLMGGLILVLAAVSKPVLSERPLTSAMLYLFIGALLSPQAAGYLPIDPWPDAPVLERVSELAVVISLFVCGLKIHVRANDRLWLLPLRLAFVSMMITVALIAFLGVTFLSLSLGLAVVLGAVLAPTDPVLASEVQVKNTQDRDQVRFALTGEAGFNDGTAFPFVYLGLGLLGLHELGAWGSRWFVIEVLWATLGGLLLGALLGSLAGLVAKRITLSCQDSEGVHEFLAFGLVFLAYGMALALNTHAFLAAFSSGLALRFVESQGDEKPEASQMSHDILGFKERVERLLEAVTVILVGAIVAQISWDKNLIWFVPVLFLLIRPLAVWLGLAGAKMKPIQRRYVSWLGIRGIGSVYYLSYAANHGIPGPHVEMLSSLVYPVLAISILVHGFSVHPLMSRYGESKEEEDDSAEQV